MTMPTVAIIGRPNVGKSSLFNRFLQRPLAVVHEQPGITRDRNYATCDWGGASFCLVDTGGLVPESQDLLEQLIWDQTEFAVNEADLVLLVVDSQTGVDPADRGIARRLHQSARNCLLVANKADNELAESETYEFLALGLGDPVLISATAGRGIGELLDKIVSLLPLRPPDEAVDESCIKVAVVGRPNVGKSSFINHLAGQPRLLVTPISGTTRDAVDTPLEFGGQKYILIDTAGLRRKYKVHENIEFYSVLRTERAIDRCDVAIVLIDGVDGLTTHDQHVLDMVFSCRRSAVLAVNKWDLVEKETSTADQYSKAINAILARNAFLPVIYVSALTGQRVHKVLTLVQEVYAEASKRIPTPRLNEFLQKAVRRHQPPARQGKHIKISYIVQTEIQPPTFVLFANQPRLIAKSYIAYLSNEIRREYGFAGVPFRVKFKKK
ncbi:MAG TPA: ribosome biogenesis GTPase Der [Candidatus Deferrimicrobium sp.]|nr:ribosome biogenesis GTPase Der [Candidatus Deferrimicrobium sp.]